MNIYRHVYAIVALGIVLAAVGVANPSLKVKPGQVQSVLVTNTSSTAVPVSVTGTASVSGTVNVANTTGNPIPVKDVDRATVTHLSFTPGIFFSSGVTQTSSSFYTVPAGKVLVVDSLALQSFNMPGGQKMVNMGLVGDVEHPIPIQFQGNDANGIARFVGAFSGTMRFPAGTEVKMFGYRDSGTGACGGEGFVEAHLESA